MAKYIHTNKQNFQDDSLCPKDKASLSSTSTVKDDRSHIYELAIKALLEFSIMKFNSVQEKIEYLILNNIFDEKFYISKYPDVVNFPYSPIIHYIYYGIFEKRIPGPYIRKTMNKEDSAHQSNNIDRTEINQSCFPVDSTGICIINKLNSIPIFTNEWHEFICNSKSELLLFFNNINEFPNNLFKDIYKTLMCYNPEGWFCSIESFNNNLVSGYVKREDTNEQQFISLDIDFINNYECILCNDIGFAEDGTPFKNNGYRFELSIDLDINLKYHLVTLKQPFKNNIIAFKFFQ